jgi:Arc/MetJ-type ribon-helix-helix transcriptional regulator
MRRRRLNKVSFQLTDEQLSWLRERKDRLGLVSDAEALRDALRKLVEMETAKSRDGKGAAA